MRLSDSVCKLKCMMWMVLGVRLDLVECLGEVGTGGCFKVGTGRQGQPLFIHKLPLPIMENLQYHSVTFILYWHSPV